MRSSINYNCFGYALGVPEWLGFEPDLSEHFINWIESSEEKDIVFVQCVEELLSRFNERDIRLEYDPRKKLPKGRYMFAFRIGDYDFHFAKRDGNNHWRHKPGMGDIRAMKYEELISDNWSSHKYNSPVAFFSINIIK